MADTLNKVGLGEGMTSSNESHESDPSRNSRTVLTLLGGERQAKQLFSSLGKRKTPDDFNELALPNGISATTVLPTHSLNENEEQKATLRDLLHRPGATSNLPTPRPSKFTVTRGSSVYWHTPSFTSPKTTVDRRGAYSTQPLTTGSWLDYNLSSTSGQDTVDSKRKPRDRRLSYDEAPSPTRAEVVAAQNQAKDDALFQSVYSGSMAPNRDDSLAVVPTQTKNRLWWSKYGCEQYQELLSLKDEALYDLQDEETPINDDLEGLDEKAMAEIIEHWEPPSIGGTSKPTPEQMVISKSYKKAQETLDEISELIEGISSYQRARHESSAPNARTPAYNSTNSVDIGTPSDPSPAEREMYEAAKAKLSDLVSELPPYVLSKLHGDQLGLLRVSTKIVTEGKNQKGTMEEDELSAKSKAALRSAAPAVTTQTPNAHTSAHPRTSHVTPAQAPSQQYSRTPYNATSTFHRRSSDVPNSYVAGQYGARPTPAPYQAAAIRAAYSAHQPYASHRPSAYADRYPTSTYNSPHTYGSYANGYRPTGQQASSYSHHYSTPQSRVQAPPAASMQTYRANPPDYQQRTPAAAHGAYHYSHTPNLTAPAGSPQPQHRPPHSTPGQTIPAPRVSYYQQSTPAPATPPTGAPQTNGVTASTNGVSEHAPVTDPASMINHQKAQLADPQRRQGSGTPQPAVENGVQQNGVSSFPSSQ